MTKDQRKPEKQFAGETNPQEILRLRKAITEGFDALDPKLEEIKKAVNKKDKKFFTWLQIAGTLLVLAAWYLQNFSVSDFDANIAYETAMKTDLSNQFNTLNFNKIEMDVARGNSRFDSNNVSIRINLIEMIGIWQHSMIDYCRKSVNTVPLGIRYSNLRWTDGARDTLQKDLDKWDNLSQKYRFTFNLDSLSFTGTFISLSANRIQDVMSKAADEYMTRLETDRKRYSLYWKVFYIFGSVMIVASLLKSIKFSRKKEGG